MPTSDEKLLVQAIQGDEDALCALLERHGPRVRRELRIAPQWRAAVDADDVLQVTFIEAFLHITQFKRNGPDPAAAFFGWLKRTAENNLRDAIKELERDKRPPPGKRVQASANAAEGDSYLSLLEILGGATTTPSRHAAHRELRQTLDNALRRLPPDYAAAVRLHHLEGRSGPETAAAMGRSHGAVKMLLARALDRLREILGTDSQFFSG